MSKPEKTSASGYHGIGSLRMEQATSDCSAPRRRAECEQVMRNELLDMQGVVCGGGCGKHLSNTLATPQGVVCGASLALMVEALHNAQRCC